MYPEQGGVGYLSYQDIFVWRKIAFLWSESKNWGVLALPVPLPMVKSSSQLRSKLLKQVVVQNRAQTD